MLTYYLRSSVSFNAFAAGVPIGHHARRIEHIKCIIRYTTYKGLELALALEKLVCRSLGNVTGDFSVAYQLTVFIDWIDND